MTAVPQTNHHALPLGDAHLVRVCLDLQLDAMLLAVGASAARPAPQPTGPGPAQPPASTWNRWLLEDLQMVCALAAEVLRGGAALPPTFGTEPGPTTSSSTVEHLTARYESMAALLAGVVDAADQGPAVQGPADQDGADQDGADSDGADRDVPAVGGHSARLALTRCRYRLAELTQSRRGPAPVTRWVTPSVPRPGDPTASHFLPGELLG